MKSPALACIALPLWLAAAPAIAQAAPPEPTADAAEMTRMARALQDPAMQDRMADSLSAMMGALLAMPVGPFAQLAREIDPEASLARIPADATLADLAARRDPHLARRLDRQARRGMAAMGTMAGGLAAMMPALETAMAQLARSMDGIGPAGD